jgi:hypothetical protein
MTNKLIKSLKKMGYILILTVGYTLVGIIVWSGVFYLLNKEASYTDSDTIEEMTGVELPEFRVIDSKMKQVSSFDFEQTGGADIEFLEVPDEAFFRILDSKLNDGGKNKEEIEGEWTRNGNKYTYSLMPMGGKSDFVREDGYFFLYIDKYSRKASMTYGNY